MRWHQAVSSLSICGAMMAKLSESTEEFICFWTWQYRRSSKTDIFSARFVLRSIFVTSMYELDWLRSDAETVIVCKDIITDPLIHVGVSVTHH